MSATRCPFCGFVAISPWEEYAHMSTWHPEVVAERLNAIGERTTGEEIRAAWTGPDVPPRVTE